MLRDKTNGTSGAVPRSGPLATAVTTSRQSLGFGAWLVRLARNFGPQDWYISGYFVLLTLAVLFGTGPGESTASR